MLTFKTLLIDVDKKMCYLDNTEIKLSKNEFNLLVFLIQNKNKIFSRQELINAVWEEPSSKRAVDTTVSRLRKKLGEVSKYITTRLGFGYGILD